MARLLTLRRNLARLLTRDEVDDNFVNVASDFSGAVDPATLTGAYVAPYMRWADTGTGWLKRRNSANDGWVSEQRLLRRTVQPFNTSELPTADGGPIYVNGQGMAEFDAAAGKYRVVSPVPVGAVAWWPLRSSMPAGRIPADGQTISRATFPDLAAMVLAGTVPLATEADWLADPRNRGCYTAGDGSTTIRVPDLNGRSSGSLGRVFLSGDGMDAAPVGVIQPDQFQNHGHLINIKTSQGGSPAEYGTVPYGQGANSQYSTVDAPVQNGAPNGVPRVGNKTHPQNVAGAWTIQAFGAVTNPGAADAAQLASDYAALNAGVQTLNAAFQTVRGQAFGVGQSMQNVAGSRTIGVAYTNTTGRPIVVYISGDTNTSAGGNLGITIGGLFVTRAVWASQGIALAVTAVIPPGIAYVANASGVSLSQWQEYR
ncbi:phage tail protein [Achromobacter xylosoxidans]|uniref:phage tail protein n=1 Tax=Alcaligenes xylosoxydans xylosoxydans TaxID=85698 RepID=UPI002ACAED5B|nr:phage tail protein [Achromobacter xylosoxidans]MDZ5616704.1 phage tail protein [Achromobacter xylosoxidans]MDZ5626106.1 phage tail protein [Achromobacter xylosoxidans]MDZ5686864.1 phage tail protein [Achromobacter xylosoxidans]